MRVYKFLILVFALFLCGCSYHSKSLFGGYSDFRAAKDTFIVSYEGNAFVRYEQVLKYVFQRAAILTMDNEYSYFSISSTQDTSENRVICLSSSVSSVSVPSVTIRIKCYKEKPLDADVINASEYLQYNKASRRRCYKC